MQRSLAFLLAGCLAISPVSAGFTSVQTYAAEAGRSENISVTIEVNGEESSFLNTDTQFALQVGDSCNLSAELDQSSDPYHIAWSSEDQDIVEVDDNGSLTAQSAGTCRITLKITSDQDGQTESLSYEITVAEPEVQENEEGSSTEDEAETASDGASEEEATAGDNENADEIPDENSGSDNTGTAPADGNAEADSTEESSQAASTGESADTASTDENAEIASVDENAETTSTDGNAEITSADETSEAASTDEAAAELTTEETQTLALGISAEAAVTDAEATTVVTKTGWTGSGKNRSYINEDGTKATGLLRLENKSYYFDSTGVLNFGWIKTAGGYYYADESGVLKSGWLTLGQKKYYLDPSSLLRTTGIKKIDGKLYVFSKSGVFQEGDKWFCSYMGKVYIKSDNTLKTGWFKYKGKKYYLQSNGVAKTGKLVLNNKLYWFNKNGAMITGWLKSGKNKYYFKSNGTAVKGWKKINGKRYFFKKSGVMQIGWYKTGGKIYYFNAKGWQIYGFKKIGKYRYYLRKDGKVTKGWKKISGKWYYFDKNCKMKTGWLTLGSKKFYLQSNGVMVTGSKKIGGVTYYFNSEGVLIPSVNDYKNTEEFIQRIAPLIIKYAPRYNVKVYSPVIAQAILESASGQSSLGKVYNNFFGLKCGTLWKGPSVNLLTGEEYTAGTYTTIAADFRVFDNMEEGVKGYFEFLFNNRTRYNNLKGETDPYRYLVKIKEDGYATSSKYVENTYNVIKSYNLTRFDD